MAGFREQLHGGPVNDEEIVRVREATGASLRSCVCAAGPESCPELADS